MASNNNVDRYDGKEEDENNKIKTAFRLPSGVDENHISVKYGKNSYIIEYNIQKTEQKKNSFYQSSYKSHYAKSFPYEIKNPSAIVQNNEIVFEFDKGKEIQNDITALESKEMKTLSLKSLK